MLNPIWLCISKPGIALRALRATMAVCPVALSTRLISSGCAKAAPMLEPWPHLSLLPWTGTYPSCKLLWLLMQPIGKVILTSIFMLGQVSKDASKESLPASPQDMWWDSIRLWQYLWVNFFSDIYLGTYICYIFIFPMVHASVVKREVFTLGGSSPGICQYPHHLSLLQLSWCV